jgi:hypothetical protein
VLGAGDTVVIEPALAVPSWDSWFSVGHRPIPSDNLEWAGREGGAPRGALTQPSGQGGPPGGGRLGTGFQSMEKRLLCGGTAN